MVPHIIHRRKMQRHSLGNEIARRLLRGWRSMSVRPRNTQRLPPFHHPATIN